MGKQEKTKREGELHCLPLPTYFNNAKASSQLLLPSIHSSLFSVFLRKNQSPFNGNSSNNNNRQQVQHGQQQQQQQVQHAVLFLCICCRFSPVCIANVNRVVGLPQRGSRDMNILTYSHSYYLQLQSTAAATIASCCGCAGRGNGSAGGDGGGSSQIKSQQNY